MAKAKLNQIIAVVTGKKTRAKTLLTASHRGWNAEAIGGVARTYEPKEEGGDQLPPESKRIHVDVVEIVRRTMDECVSFYDAVMTQDEGNTVARSHIVIGDAVLLRDIPVTTLLFVEKQLVDLHTFASNLPTLSPDRKWVRDTNRNCWATEPTETLRTQKQHKTITLAPPTKEHPAQVQLVAEDKVVGTWTTENLSSAIPAEQKAAILGRIERLQDAVKRAREHANSIDVEQLKHGRTIIDYVFGAMTVTETRAQSKA